MTTVEQWEHAQKLETGFWSNPEVRMPNGMTLVEMELEKQRTYMRMMHLQDTPRVHVLDIGGGPIPIVGRMPTSHAYVLDPMDLPWNDQYNIYPVERVKACAEDILPEYADNTYDEIWMYNCLQHTRDPALIIHHLGRVASVLRIFEWTLVPTDEMHPHKLWPDMFRAYHDRSKWYVHSWVEGKLSDEHCVGDFIAFHVSLRH